MGGKTKVIIWADNEIYSTGLRAILEADTSIGDVEVIKDTDTLLLIFNDEYLFDVFLVVSENSPDYANYFFPDMKKSVESKVIFLMGSLKTAHELLRLGMTQYLPTYCSSTELIEAVHNVVQKHSTVASNEKPLTEDERIAEIRKKIRERRQLSKNEAWRELEFLDEQGYLRLGKPLTKREAEILSAIAKGLSNKEIAEALLISESTVETHKSNLKKKLELTNPKELMIYAVKHRY